MIKGKWSETYYNRWDDSEIEGSLFIESQKNINKTVEEHKGNVFWVLNHNKKEKYNDIKKLFINNKAELFAFDLFYTNYKFNAYLSTYLIRFENITYLPHTIPIRCYNGIFTISDIYEREIEELLGIDSYNKKRPVKWPTVHYDTIWAECPHCYLGLRLNRDVKYCLQCGTLLDWNVKAREMPGSGKNI